MDLKEFIEKSNRGRRFIIRPRIICNDGFTISVQGGKFHHSTPKETSNNYLDMELAYPSEYEELIIEFANDKSNPTDTFYPYVPFHIIEKVIEKHGGINVEKQNFVKGTDLINSL